MLSIKDLTDREREILAAHSAKVFTKGSGWRPHLIAELHRTLGAVTNKKRVLLADDNAAGRELVREALGSHVAALIEAADGREACAWWR